MPDLGMPDFGAARLNMVENQVRTNDVTDLDVQDAMRVVERERFVAPDKQALAYAETSVGFAPGYALLEPRILSKLLQALMPRRGETALVICEPYAAAVLTEIGLVVAEVEPEVFLVGSTIAGTFDVILAGGAVASTPEAWLAVLSPVGRLGVVERSGPVGRARLYSRATDGSVAGRDVFDATPPWLPGMAPQAAFAL